MIDRARRGDDTRDDMLGQLNGISGYAAGATLNENGLAPLELDRVLDRDKRRQASERQGCGVDVGERSRFGAENGRLLGDFLLIGTIASAGQHAEYGVADLEIINAGPERAHDAGEVA